MRSLACTGPQTLEWQEAAAPSLQSDGDALVRPIAVATCDLDAAMMQPMKEYSVELLKHDPELVIDTILQMLPKANRLNKPASLGLREKGFSVVTLHRPSNVDDLAVLKNLVDVLIEVSSEIPLVFPIHPRTRQRVDAAGLSGRIEAAKGLHLLPPLGYLEFLSLTSQAKFIISDSGGLQEESTALGIPCLTMRSNTERPITVDLGTSTLIGNDPEKLRFHLREILDCRYKTGRCPELWDGRAAERIADILVAAD
jgi:UDP-N-acetylglucosamine 2-epimerase (non-hydrolysing)